MPLQIGLGWQLPNKDPVLSYKTRVMPSRPASSSSVWHNCLNSGPSAEAARLSLLCVKGAVPTRELDKKPARFKPTQSLDPQASMACQRSKGNPDSKGDQSRLEIGN